MTPKNYKEEIEEGITETTGGCAVGCALLIIVAAVMFALGIAIDLLRRALI